MEKLKKIVLTGAVVWFSTLVVYNSFGNREELDLNSAKVNDNYTWENSIKSTQDLFLKSFLKQDLSIQEVNDALESISYYNNLLQNNYYNSGDLNQINNNFLDHIEKYIDENKMEEFKKVIYKKLDFSKDLDKSYNSWSNEIESEDSTDIEDTTNNEDNQNISENSKKDLPKIQNNTNLSNKSEFIIKAKKEILDKYSNLIDKIPKEKLPVILEKITWKISQVNNSSLAQEKKEKSLILLTALSEIVNEKINSSIDDISIEELLK